jgi:ribosome recycling factor
MPEENKYANLPLSMMPLVRSQVLERIKALEDVVEAHKKSIDEVLKPVMEQIEEANTDLEWVNAKLGSET